MRQNLSNSEFSLNFWKLKKKFYSIKEKFKISILFTADLTYLKFTSVELIYNPIKSSTLFRKQKFEIKIEVLCFLKKLLERRLDIRRYHFQVL